MEPKSLRSGFIHFDSRPVSSKRNSVNGRCESVTLPQRGRVAGISTSRNTGAIRGQTPTLTTSSGLPVADNRNSITAGRHGPVLMRDFQCRHPKTYTEAVIRALTECRHRRRPNRNVLAPTISSSHQILSRIEERTHGMRITILIAIAYGNATITARKQEYRTTLAKGPPFRI
jgi:hypothetical protein